MSRTTHSTSKRDTMGSVKSTFSEKVSEGSYRPPGNTDNQHLRYTTGPILSVTPQSQFSPLHNTAPPHYTAQPIIISITQQSQSTAPLHHKANQHALLKNTAISSALLHHTGNQHHCLSPVPSCAGGGSIYESE